MEHVNTRERRMLIEFIRWLRETGPSMMEVEGKLVQTSSPLDMLTGGWDSRKLYDAFVHNSHPFLFGDVVVWRDDRVAMGYVEKLEEKGSEGVWIRWLTPSSSGVKLADGRWAWSQLLLVRSGDREIGPSKVVVEF